MAASMKTRLCLRFLQKSPIKDGRSVMSFQLFSRSYSRPIRRNVRRILTQQDELQSLKKTATKMKDPKKNAFVPFVPGDPIQSSWVDVDRRNFTKKDQFKDKKWLSFEDNSPTVSNQFTYTKMMDDDAEFGNSVMEAKSKKLRAESGRILLEGKRLIKDAIMAGVTVEKIFFSGESSILKEINTTGVQNFSAYKVLYKHMKLWSDTQTPQGIMAICKMPKVGEGIHATDDSLPITMIADNVKDPGNMGNLIRTAAAVGVKNFLAVKGCVDIWEPKVLRAGSGSHFHVPIINNIPWEHINNYIGEGSHVFAADLQKNISDEINSDEAEVLIKSSQESMKSVDFTENEDDFDDKLEISEGYLDTKLMKLYRNAPLSSCEYTKTDFKQDNIVFVVGGETVGLTAMAKKLVFDNYGQVVYIPMSNNVDSLNSSVAASIILYEIRRQLSS